MENEFSNITRNESNQASKNDFEPFVFFINEQYVKKINK